MNPKEIADFYDESYKMDYTKALDDNYKFQGEYLDYPYESKLHYVGEVIFDFTTYDSDVSEMLARKMLEACEAIVNRKPFEYIDRSNENYLNYITMVNMPFMRDKIEWGTSIRGAWFDTYSGEEHWTDCGRIKVPAKDINEFIETLIEWVK